MITNNKNQNIEFIVKDIGEQLSKLNQNITGRALTKSTLTRFSKFLGLNVSKGR